MSAPGLQQAVTNQIAYPVGQRPPTRRPSPLPAFAAHPGRPPPGRERVLSVHFLPNPSARGMDSETPSLPTAATRLRGPRGRPPPGRDRVLSVRFLPNPDAGEWTVRHHPYRLPLPAFAAPGAAHLPVGIESSRSAHAHRRYRRNHPTILRQGSDFSSTDRGGRCCRRGAPPVRPSGRASTGIG